MCSGAGHTTWLVRGSPIRTSSDQRSVGSSPRLIAASYVLHRLLVPRHPPCALNNLATQKTAPSPPEGNNKAGLHKLCFRVQKMLASTVQFSTYDRSPPARPRRTRTPHGGQRRYEEQDGPDRENNPPVSRAGPLPQDPTACLRTGPRPP